jgi:hypothetical protein
MRAQANAACRSTKRTLFKHQLSRLASGAQLGAVDELLLQPRINKPHSNVYAARTSQLELLDKRGYAGDAQPGSEPTEWTKRGNHKSGFIRSLDHLRPSASSGCKLAGRRALKKTSPSLCFVAEPSAPVTVAFNALQHGQSSPANGWAQNKPSKLHTHLQLTHVALRSNSRRFRLDRGRNTYVCHNALSGTIKNRLESPHPIWQQGDVGLGTLSPETRIQPMAP